MAISNYFTCPTVFASKPHALAPGRYAQLHCIAIIVSFTELEISMPTCFHWVKFAFINSFSSSNGNQVFRLLKMNTTWFWENRTKCHTNCTSYALNWSLIKPRSLYESFKNTALNENKTNSILDPADISCGGYRFDVGDLLLNRHVLHNWIKTLICS